MGTIHHHAIVVTSWKEDLLSKAHAVATGLSPHVTPIIKATSNGYLSFAVLPDGSKEGWAESDVGDAARAALLRWIDSRAYDDGSNALSYAEVSFGELPPNVATNGQQGEAKKLTPPLTPRCLAMPPLPPEHRVKHANPARPEPMVTQPPRTRA